MSHSTKRDTGDTELQITTIQYCRTVGCEEVLWEQEGVLRRTS